MLIDEILYQLGEDHDAYFGAIAPPIVQTSNFRFTTVRAMREALSQEYDHLLYSRGRNPTADILRKKLAALEAAEDCLVVNSGAAAFSLAVFAFLEQGDHVVCVDKPYTWVQHLFNRLLSRYGVSVSYVDARELAHVEAAIRPNTRLLYLESPNSWDYAIQDLAAIASLARSRGIKTICDNSYSTGLGQQPIALGIDISIQSATKYISGHSDTVAGVICGSREDMSRIFHTEYMTLGCGIQPFNAWLLLRGLRTLPLRLERSSQSAMKVLQMLRNESLVEALYYPLDPHFSQYTLASRQMKMAGGLLTVQFVAVTRAQIEAFCERLSCFRMAVSWGGYESLVIPRCAGMAEEAYDPGNPEHRMVRLYIGLEDPALLMDDLRKGFGVMGEV